jgi:hypothetical protein
MWGVTGTQLTPHINNHDYVGRPLDIKPCVSVTPHIHLCEVLLMHQI